MSAAPVLPAACSGILMARLRRMSYWMKASQRIWKKKMKMTDERSKQITEIMSGIRIIKFMSWENRFMDKVRVTRDKEIKLQIKNQMLSALLSAVYSSLPILMIVIVLGKIAMLSRFACCPSR